jgi:hypothetical protein
MKKYSALALIIAILSSTIAFSADDIIVPNNQGKSYLKDNAGNLYPLNVVMTTDGNSNLQPVFSTNSSFTIGTVAQGTNNDGTHPWHVIDDTFIADFDAWKTFANVNLSTLASDAHLLALSAKFGSLGQAAMAGSAPVVIASDQSAIPVNSTAVGNTTVIQPTGSNLHVAVDSGSITANIGSSGGLALDSTVSSINAKLGSLGQKAMAGSAPVVIASDQAAFPVTASGSGNFTVVQPTGTNLHSVVDSGSITANVGTTGGLALDSSITSLSAKFGSLGQKTSAGSAPVVLASDQSAIPVTANAGTGNFTVVQPTGTNLHAVIDSGTVSATQSGNWSNRLQDGNGNIVTSQLSSAQRALDVGIDVSGTQVDPRSIRSLTSADVVTAAQGTAAASSGAWPAKVTDGTNVMAVKAASTAAVATDTSAVVALSPNSPIPTGSNVIGALTANQSVNLNQVAGSAVATAATGIPKVGLTDGSGNALGSTAVSAVNYLNVRGTASGLTGSAVPTYALYHGGINGGNLVGMAVDASGNTQVVGNVASGSADSGNPVKTGSVYNSTLPSPSTGNRVDLQSNQFGMLATSFRGKFKNIAGAATTTVKSGAGVLHAIIVGATGGGFSIEAFDNTAGSGTIIANLTNTTGGSVSIPIDAEFATGLTIVTAGAGNNITAVYY